jgi:hypothetical protein
LSFLAWALGPAAYALTLELPAPILSEESREVPGSYALPTGPFENGTLPTRTVEGAIDQRALQLDAPDVTTLALLAPLREQVIAAGFEVLLDCDARACGGFDFRYGTEVLPEPDMHVDLGDFRFLSATRGDEAVSLLVSRSALSGYVQITRVTAVPAGGLVPDAQMPPVIELRTTLIATWASLRCQLPALLLHWMRPERRFWTIWTLPAGRRP